MPASLEERIIRTSGHSSARGTLLAARGCTRVVGGLAAGPRFVSSLRLAPLGSASAENTSARPCAPSVFLFFGCISRLWCLGWARCLFFAVRVGAASVWRIRTSPSLYHVTLLTHLSLPFFLVKATLQSWTFCMPVGREVRRSCGQSWLLCRKLLLAFQRRVSTSWWTSCSRLAAFLVSFRGMGRRSRCGLLSSGPWVGPAPSPRLGLRASRSEAGHRAQPRGSSRRN